MDIERLKPVVKRILLIFWGHFGEILITTPLLEVLGQAFPRAYLTFAVGGHGHRLLEHASKILEHNPYVDRCIKSDKSIFKKIITDRPYDLAVDLCGGKVSKLMVFLSGAKVKIWGRFREKPREYFCSRRSNGKWSVPVRIPLGKDSSKMEHILKVARTLGIETNGNIRPKLYLSKEERAFSRNYFKQIRNKKTDIIIAMHPGGRNPARLWEVKNYALLADKLIDKFKVKVIIFCGPGEEYFAEGIGKLAKNPLIKISRKSIRKYAALVSECDFFISTDGGPLHIARALGVPSVGIFKDQKNMHYWYPYKPGDGLFAVFMPVQRRGDFDRQLNEVERVFRKVRHLLTS